MDITCSPGNKKAGLTTILENRLGRARAAAKAGTLPLTGVFRYGKPITSRGFTFMDRPGHDPASVTGQIASGGTLIAFRTGRGLAFGSKPAPTVMIASNTEMFLRQRDDMDLNAGTIVSDGARIKAVGRAIHDLLLRIALGERSKSEAMGLGDHEFVPLQVGAVM
ncbi:D-galactarate dehydratase/altronate hydrolase [Cereibacter ovatus]|uniref:D-galactarate dehydratase/altronate hydrolase n=1 Tax=Cereibacter ovatus TaxID=439529 RepID=A0A285D0P7_9RHOB|nr:D-galactarate dehydratase/altronate hydrolase [Cereibacter ovatus]